MLWSAGDAHDQYQRLMQRTTPSSPLNLYSPTTVVAVTVESVSLLSPTTALVRFETTRHDPGSSTSSQQSWVAVMAFRYINAPLSMGDRFLNPLGFQVTRYRRDAETIAPAAVSAPQTAAPLSSTTPPPTSALAAGPSMPPLHDAHAP
jgi:type IV secretion system protein VirB8